MESECLHRTVRVSLGSSERLSIFKDVPGPPQQTDPRFRKLVEGILYSRRFVLIYYLVVLSILLVLSVTHWSREFIRWRRRRAQNSSGRHTDSDETSSSGSSSRSTGSVATAHIKDLDEATPLLRHEKYHAQRSTVSSVRAFLMYQPRPIPYFNKTLPSNGLSIAILVLITLNLFFLLFQINFTVFELFVFADRCGLMFVVNLPLLYLLASKNQPLRFLTGWSYESLNIFHRRLGELLCFEALLHLVGMMGVWYTILRPSGSTLAHFVLNKVIILGIGAFVSYELLYVTSLAYFRQKWYELFLGMHVLLQATALILVFFHHSASKPYVGVALAIFLIDRFLHRIAFKRIAVAADATVMEDGKTIKLSMEITKEETGSVLSTFTRRSVGRGWRATDHVFVTAPPLGRKHLIQAHPFTILSPAPVFWDKSHQLELLIRAQDGFSGELLQRISQESRLNIWLDGPYGSSHARTLLEDSNLAIIIAGGSGIAVAWPLIHHLLNTRSSRDLEFASSPSFNQPQKIFFFWAVHNKSHISWIGQQALADLEARGVQVVTFVTDVLGRPNLHTYINTKAGLDQPVDFPKRRRTGVVVSGPDSMGREVRNICAELVKFKYDIEVVVEKFGW